jgi:hypothetical protein
VAAVVLRVVAVTTVVVKVVTWWNEVAFGGCVLRTLLVMGVAFGRHGLSVQLDGVLSGQSVTCHV